MPRRLPTTLEKVSEKEQRLAHEARDIHRQREQLRRQRDRLQRKAHLEYLCQVGALVVRVGLPIEDLGTLETLLKHVASQGNFPTRNERLSNTASVPLAGEREEGK